MSVNLSLNFKESFKTALAMVIAIGIAFAMDWQRPYWAGFAVAFCSLATIGQSLEKAALRMGGTLVAVVVALVVVALFGQERWGFIIFLSLYGAVCSYLMSGSANAYFWYVCWFVVVVVSVDSGANPVNAFQTTMLRLQETGLGILVYSLVAVFIWPQHTGPRLVTAAVDLIVAQRRLLQACLTTIDGRGDPGELAHLAAEERKGKAGFDQLLQAARVDTGEIRELRPQWRSFQQQLARFSLILTLWRESFTELQKLDVQSVLPNLAEFGAELDARLEQVGRMLAGDRPGRQPLPVTLPVNEETMNKLSSVNAAAVAASCTRLLDLERSTRQQFDTLSEISGFAAKSAPLPEARGQSRGVFVPDPDRMMAVVRLVLTIWLGFLAAVYVGDLPGGFTLLTMTASIGMVVANAPQLRISVLYRPVFWGIALATTLYVFVMPALSGYLALGTMIFAVTFAICYLAAAPPPALGRTVGLAVFLILCGFANHQSYNFLSITTTSLVLIGVFFIMNLTWYFPFDLRPERVFLRQLRRFFRSSDYLISTLQGSHEPTGWWTRRLRAFHRQEVALLPAKLAGWAPLIDPKMVASASPREIQELVGFVQSMSIQLQQIMEQRRSPDLEIADSTLPPEFDLWQRGIQAGLSRLANEQDLATVSRELQIKFEDLGRELTAGIGSAFEQHREEFDQQKLETYYRLLDACRGTAVALLNCSRIMAGIDWARWRQERFA